MCQAAQPLAAIAASRYALGADGVGAARPGACGSPVAASRCALFADGVGAARPGACGSPVAASRCALFADGVGAARPGACGSPGSRPRAARSAPMAWALRRCAPGRLQVPPPITRALPLSGGHVVVEDVVRFALIETLGARRALRAPAEGAGGGGCFRHHHARACGENGCVLPQHVQCESARRASAAEAPYPQAKPTPRTLSARARLHAAGEGRHDGHDDLNVAS